VEAPSFREATAGGATAFGVRGFGQACNGGNPEGVILWKPIDEFTFRFSRRTCRWRGKLFHRLLRQAVLTEPTRYHQIIKPQDVVGG
jgi:hypothetical protein